MAYNIPGKWDTRKGDAINEAQMRAINQKLDPNNNSGDIGKLPFYSSAARTFIKIGGKPLGVAQDLSWNVSYTATPIYAIDSPFPYDIDIGQCMITARLGSIIDPTKGPEVDSMMHVMASAVHAPMCEIQALDRGTGTSIFFARGLFHGISGNISIGKISSWNANFTGVAYQHYVAQSFKPYSIVGGIEGALNSLQNLTSTLGF